VYPKAYALPAVAWKVHWLKFIAPMVLLDWYHPPKVMLEWSPKVTRVAVRSATCHEAPSREHSWRTYG
jgi:hypothetical protein